MWNLKSEGNGNKEVLTIEEKQCVVHSTEVKVVRPLSSLPRGHVVTADFNGNLVVWNSEVYNIFINDKCVELIKLL